MHLLTYYKKITASSRFCHLRPGRNSSLVWGKGWSWSSDLKIQPLERWWVGISSLWPHGWAVIKEISKKDMIGWMWCTTAVQALERECMSSRPTWRLSQNGNLAWSLTIIHQDGVKWWLFAYFNFVGVSKASQSGRSEVACKNKSKSGLTCVMTW